MSSDDGVHLLFSANVLGSFQLFLKEMFHVAHLILLFLDFLLELSLPHLCYASLCCTASQLALQLIEFSLNRTHKDVHVSLGYLVL